MPAGRELDRESFTTGTPDMVDAMVRRLPEQYPLELNPGDMTAVILALATAVGFVTWEDVDAADESLDRDSTRERAESLFSGIAETLGIEGI